MDDIVLPKEAPYADSVYHLYIIRSDQRDELKHFLAERGIQTGIHYPVPIHLQPACAHLGHTVGSFPIAETFARQALSLPLFSEMKPHQIEYVGDAIQQFFI